MAQSVKYLLCKCEDLDLYSRTHGKVVGMGACACNRNSGGGDRNIPRACQSASLAELVLSGSRKGLSLRK